jgi:murein DD-endopeptidase MepM/ murein hydrolase activator NlpD
MIRALRAPSRVDTAWRLVAPVLVLALLFSVDVVTAATTEAAGVSSAAALRTRQLNAEAAMRRADRQIRELKSLRANHKKLFKKAKRELERAKKQRDKARRKADKVERKLAQQRLTLARQTRVHPDPNGRQRTDKPALRKQIRKLAQKHKRLDRKLRKAERRVDQARERKQSRLKKPTRERIAKRTAERERAEDKLSRSISAMLSYAGDRAGRLGAASASDLRRPVRGHVTQAFGCTGYYINPRRGSCRHFHDGLDIAAPKGRWVKAAADGYVAYAGYSPWDRGARAFIVITVHAGGVQTVYAHLKPTRKVKAGQRVERGDVIGAVGMTGTTSGPHVHWEVRRHGRLLDPRKA